MILFQRFWKWRKTNLNVDFRPQGYRILVYFVYQISRHEFYDFLNYALAIVKNYIFNASVLASLPLHRSAVLVAETPVYELI